MTEEPGPPGGFGAVDVGYSEPGRARAALVVARAADFGGELAEHVACVDGVTPYSPGEFFRRELPALRAAGTRRLIVVGGAGSLRQGGGRHVDSPGFPDAWKPAALDAVRARDFYLTVRDIDWLYVSPAAVIEPGERTGTFRVGRDELLTDAAGASRISIDDYAMGLVDQLEQPAAHRAQLTLAY